MQNGQTLGEEMNVRTIKDLQDHPVDFHINPKCKEDGSECTAEGLYINDDGEVVEFEDNANMYDLSYTHNNSTIS
jgi:murein endopeptidase